jgi:hypothetical protein
MDRWCRLRDKSNPTLFPDGRVYFCLLFIEARAGNGAYWNGRSAVQIRPRRGELDACFEVGEGSSCPASAALQPTLYSGADPARIHCIYDKVPRGRQRRR